MPERPSRFVNVEAARERFGASIDRLEELLWVTDPLADAVVEAFELLPKGSSNRMLDTALREGIDAVTDAPEALRALFAEVDHVPAWVDDEALDRGGELLLRAGWFGGLGLGTSLLYGYASPGGNKPLVFSGRLAQQTPRRLVETSRFVEATCVPGGLRRFAEGFAITVRVRVVHAKVRRMLLQSGRWSSRDWGIPANQHDMGSTSLLFSAVVVESLERVGFVFDPAEVHLYMQLWRYSGYLMGVDQGILPTSEREARRLMDMVAATEAEPDEDSRSLSRALFAAGEDPPRATEQEKRRASRVVSLGQGMIRGVLGDALADQLDVPDHGWKYAFPAVRALTRGIEGASRSAPAPIARRLRSQAVATGRQYWAMLTRAASEPLTFVPPDELFGTAAAAARIVAPRGRTALAAAVRGR